MFPFPDLKKFETYHIFYTFWYRKLLLRSVLKSCILKSHSETTPECVNWLVCKQGKYDIAALKWLWDTCSVDYHFYPHLARYFFLHFDWSSTSGLELIYLVEFWHKKGEWRNAQLLTSGRYQQCIHQSNVLGTPARCCSRNNQNKRRKVRFDLDCCPQRSYSSVCSIVLHYRFSCLNRKIADDGRTHTTTQLTCQKRTR